MMRIRLTGLLLAVLLGAAGCPETPKPVKAPQEPVGTGLKVVPTGQSPVNAPGPKGVMIDMPSDEVRVLLVDPNGPAADAGFAPGDRLLAADGQDLASEDDLAKALEQAASKKVFFEVRSGDRVLTLKLNTSEPGWLVLSGDSYKGFLLTRIQSGAKRAKPATKGPAPELKLPTFDSRPFSLRAQRGHPVAILFWGTFSEPSYAHLQAFSKICQQFAPRGLECLAVDTMELFTAVARTADYAAELAKVRREFYPTGPLAIDLFMASERLYGVTKLPTLVLVDAQGDLAGRHEGALAHPFDQMGAALGPIIPKSPIQ